MVWMIAVILTMLWLLGLGTGDTLGDVIHIPLFIAIIAMLIQIEADCSAYDSGHGRKRHVKRQLVSRSGNILPELATMSARKLSQPIISPPT
jgi:hypothetical protein